MRGGERWRDKCVIGGDDGHGIDALGLEFVVLFNVGREMLDLTSRRERPRNSKQHNLLPLEFLPNQPSIPKCAARHLRVKGGDLFGVKVLGDAACGDVGRFGRVSNVPELCGREFVADFQGSHCVAIDGWRRVWREGVWRGDRSEGFEIVNEGGISRGTPRETSF
jgi:hypothetical protein